MNPMQPIVVAKDGVVRFKENKIVRWLVDSGRVDLNQVALMEFPLEDREQFWQLMGYSVSGYGDLSFVSRETVEKADEIAARLQP